MNIFYTYNFYFKFQNLHVLTKYTYITKRKYDKITKKKAENKLKNYKCYVK